MKLSLDEVRHVAELAKLELSDEEISLYAEQLSAILDYAEQIKGVDTSQVPPTPYVLPLSNVMRDDVLGECLSNEAAVANAADAKDGYFRVRAIFDE
ncbi:MAG: Asp-tRNA(Asn)/Glu-tRNA(Gln) amidotransferase subunit GatC [Caldilineaceae bacterium]|nr:Asp-tRNA(Asn)/Glu-tRNA(Gln) amidotransferase subunit GatC [Caldilineaceae bacterium]